MNQMMSQSKPMHSHHTSDNGPKSNYGPSKTQSLYYRFKAIKDRNRAKLILKHKEEEKIMKKKAIKKGGGSDQLQSLNSFQKQAANNEYSDFIAKEYYSIQDEAIKRKNASKKAILNHNAPSQGPGGLLNYLAFTIRSNDAWKIWWDSTILIIAIFNSVTIPLQISF